jgi:hypothetical protein
MFLHAVDCASRYQSTHIATTGKSDSTEKIQNCRQDARRTNIGRKDIRRPSICLDRAQGRRKVPHSTRPQVFWGSNGDFADYLCHLMITPFAAPLPDTPRRTRATAVPNRSPSPFHSTSAVSMWSCSETSQLRGQSHRATPAHRNPET